MSIMRFLFPHGLPSRLEVLLIQIMTPSQQFNVSAASDFLVDFFEEEDGKPYRVQDVLGNMLLLFKWLKKSRFDQRVQPTSYIQLLSAIHSVFSDDEYQLDISYQLKESRIPCFVDQGQCSVASEIVTEPNQNEPIQISLSTEQNGSCVDSWFTIQYYMFLQRMAANVDLIASVNKQCYPYMNYNDYIDPKLMFLWHYKIQNVMNVGLELLLDVTPLLETQKLIWNDIFQLQKFLTSEISKKADIYATLPNSDALSMFEIYTEAQRHHSAMKQFQLKARLLKLVDPPAVRIPSETLQDFLSFSSKLKMLSQLKLRKGFKVPNKDNPCMGIPLKDPNTLHLRQMSGEVKCDQEDMKQNAGQFEQDQVEEVETGSQFINPHKQKIKRRIQSIHYRGISTFQQE